MTNGIVTFADKDFIESAKLLALSAKKFSNLPTTLVTDTPMEADEFDTIIVTPCQYAEEGMITALMASPYDRTAFIYADSLVLSDITPYFELLGHQDYIFPTASDYKSHALPSTLFNNRHMITKNKLPDIWTNFFLYKKEPLNQVTCKMSTLFEFWKELKATVCPDYSNDDNLNLHFNVIMAVAMKLLNLPTHSYGTTFTNMSQQTNNVELVHLADKKWHQLLSVWATDDCKVKVENYNQVGVWHYTHKWLDDTRIDSIRKICLT